MKQEYKYSTIARETAEKYKYSNFAMETALNTKTDCNGNCGAEYK